MKIQCQLIREQWESRIKDTSFNSQVIRKMVNHIKTCNACRKFVYQHSFYPLLKESYGEEAHEPSERFFDNFAKRLDGIEHQTQEITFAEILLEKGWKLVPAMTILLVLLLGSFAYQYKNISTVVTQIPIEEFILFDDTLLNENHILYAITTEELKDEI